MGVEYKLFSDNVALYMKVGNSRIEIIRLLTFLEAIASIQKDVLFLCKLPLRGGIAKGSLCSEGSVFVGKALIDASELEKSTVYPRISLDKSIMNEAFSLLDNFVDFQFVKKEGMQEWLRSLTLKAKNEDNAYLNYLPRIELDKVYPGLNGEGRQIIECLKDSSPIDYKTIQKEKSSYSEEEFDRNLKRHRDILRKNISMFCNFDGIDKKNSEAIVQKTNIIKKYKWLVDYHNQLCAMHKKDDCVLTVNNTFDPATLNDYTDVGGVLSHFYRDNSVNSNIFHLNRPTFGGIHSHLAV